MTSIIYNTLLKNNHIEFNPDKVVKNWIINDNTFSFDYEGKFFEVTINEI